MEKYVKKKLRNLPRKLPDCDDLFESFYKFSQFSKLFVNYREKKQSFAQIEEMIPTEKFRTPLRVTGDNSLEKFFNQKNLCSLFQKPK